MFKNTTLLFTFVFFAFGFLKAEEGEWIPDYTVIQDKKDLTVKKGYTKVYGTVSKNNVPVSNARISTLDHKTFGVSDKNGKFSFLISEKDSALYVYKSYHSEIVINKYEFKSQHAVEVDFYMRDDLRIDAVDKPVIYLYPKEKTNINIDLKIKGKLTFTYPKLAHNSWNIQADKSGQISVGEKTYPYLFWEGKQTGLHFQKTNNGEISGYHINTDTCISFLEHTLSKIGLNEKEQTDFITFWGPKMIAQQFASVQFLIDEDYDKTIAEIDINPKPNTVKRVFMFFYPSKEENSSLTFKTPSFSPFKRDGFTLIEWGGSQLNYIHKSL